MHTTFVFEGPVGTLTLRSFMRSRVAHFHRNIAKASVVILVLVYDAYTPAFSREELSVHFKKHSRKVLGVVTACPAKNRHNGITAVKVFSISAVLQCVVLAKYLLRFVFIQPK